eukprot:6408517-Prymnesium_polylepis.1
MAQITGSWVDVSFVYDDGLINVTAGGIVLHDAVPIIPIDPVAATAWRLIIAARTGGSWAEHRVDDVSV